MKDIKVGVFLCCFLNFGFAEETVKLDVVEIQGTESAFDEDLSREVFPYNVSIIEIDPLDEQNTSLQDFLEEQTSVSVKSLGGRADYSTVSIRGSTASQVSVFVDGVEVNRGDRQAVDLSTLKLDQFKKIEVYRNHAPARFGTGRIGGVIHLISDKSRKTQRGDIKLGAGSHGYFQSQLNSYLGKEKTSHRLHLNYEKEEGDFNFVFDNFTPDNPSDDEVKTRINNDYDAYRFSWLGEHQFNQQHQLDWVNTYFNRDKGLAGAPRFQTTDVRYKEEHFNSLLNYRMRDVLGDSTSTHFSMGILQNEDQYEDKNSELGLGRQDNSYPVQSRHIGFVHEILNYPLNHTLNVQYKKERIQIKDHLAGSYAPVNKRDKWDLGYDIHAYMFKDKLELTGGVASTRIEDRFRSNFVSSMDADRDIYTWSVGGIYEIQRHWFFKSSLSKGLRVPTFSELFGDRGASDGNNALVPEKSTNLEFGLSYSSDELGLLRNVKSDWAWFRNDKDELIAYVFDSRGVGRAFNLGDGMIEGIEWSFSTDLFYGFSYHQNLTILDTEMRRSNLAAGQGKKVPGVFEKSWNPKLNWKYENLKCSYQYDMQHDKFYDPANLNKSIDKELHHFSIQYQYKKANFALDVRNITDEMSFVDFNDWPQAGRTFLFSTLIEY